MLRGGGTRIRAHSIAGNTADPRRLAHAGAKFRKRFELHATAADLGLPVYPRSKLILRTAPKSMMSPVIP